MNPHPIHNLLFMVLSLLLPTLAFAAPIAIIVDPTDTPPVQSAALELQKNLNQQTQTQIPILPPSDPQTHTRRFIIGPKAALSLQPQLSQTLATLGPESFLLRTTPAGDTLLAGGHPRGTLYAVLTALHDNGCRWWTPTASLIPARDISAFPKYPSDNPPQSPAFEYRDLYYLQAFDPQWALHNRTNGTRANIPPSLGGSTKTAFLVHSYFKLLPPEKYFDAHPDWYSLLDGKRTKDKSQLCLTNPDMLQEVIKNTRDLLKQKENATTISISQNDWAGGCTCPSCKAIDDQEGSPSGNIINFTNAVAAALKPEFPHVTFSTLAYEYSVAPPKTIRPADNVVVYVCTTRAGFEKPIINQPTRPIAAQIKSWSAIARVYVWDYLPNFSHICLPHPNLYVIGPNFLFYKTSGVRGVFAQGIYNTPASEFAELRAWLAAQLLWDPSQDSSKLIQEFVTGYYGPAAPAVMNHIPLHQAAIEKFDGKLTLYSRATEKYLTLELWLHAWQAMQDAEKLAAASPDPEHAKRIAAAQLPLRYQYVIRFTDFQTQAAQKNLSLPPNLPNSLPDAIADFKTRAAQSGLNRIYENKPGFARLDELLNSQ